jgi:hypothetical protein
MSFPTNKGRGLSPAAMAAATTAAAAMPPIGVFGAGGGEGVVPDPPVGILPPSAPSAPNGGLESSSRCHLLSLSAVRKGLSEDLPSIAETLRMCLKKKDKGGGHRFAALPQELQSMCAAISMFRWAEKKGLTITSLEKLKDGFNSFIIDARPSEMTALLRPLGDLLAAIDEDEVAGHVVASSSPLGPKAAALVLSWEAR